MRYKRLFLSFLVAALLCAPVAAVAQSEGGGEQEKTPAVVVAAPLRSMQKLLPDSLAGMKATGDLKQYADDNLAEIAGDKAQIYQEYHVRQAASRQYGNLRADIFETSMPGGAYGLLSFNSGPRTNWATQDVGQHSARLKNDMFFSKDNCFVRVTCTSPNPSRAELSAQVSLAKAIANLIGATDPAHAEPSLVRSLPPQRLTGSERYFLGPASLNTYVERGGETFLFTGSAEAVMAEYQAGENSAPLKLVIVEYHTPQLATEAMTKAAGFVESLPEGERNKIILKREGNYIVEAVGVEDHDYAQSLVDSVKYPYVVKWLQDRRLAGNDPLRVQKAAQLLVSVFTLLGILLLAVLVAGSIFGTIVFLKRRKRQQQVFSDAGGMVRLELDSIEAVMLGLPPKRSNED